MSYKAKKQGEKKSIFICADLQLEFEASKIFYLQENTAK
jgi:hypothetical protein